MSQLRTTVLPISAAGWWEARESPLKSHPGLSAETQKAALGSGRLDQPVVFYCLPPRLGTHSIPTVTPCHCLVFKGCPVLAVL